MTSPNRDELKLGSSESDRPSASRELAVLIAVLFLALVPVVTFFWTFQVEKIEPSMEKWAQFGDYAAGVSAILVGMTTLALLWRNTVMVKQQLAVLERTEREQVKFIQRQIRELDAAVNAKALDEHRGRVFALITQTESAAREAERDIEALGTVIADEVRRRGYGAAAQHDEVRRSVISSCVRPFVCSSQGFTKFAAFLDITLREILDAPHDRTTELATELASGMSKVACRGAYYLAWCEELSALKEKMIEVDLFRFSTSQILFDPRVDAIDQLRIGTASVFRPRNSA
jgi:hypothetical protein